MILWNLPVEEKYIHIRILKNIQVTCGSFDSNKKLLKMVGPDCKA